MSEAIAHTENTSVTSRPRITRLRRVLAVAFGASLFSVALAEPAFAQDPGALLQNILDLLTGNTARLLAVIAVVLLGIAAIFGIFDWRKVGMVIFGIIVIFGAAEIVALISG